MSYLANKIVVVIPQMVYQLWVANSVDRLINNNYSLHSNTTPLTFFIDFCHQNAAPYTSPVPVYMSSPPKLPVPTRAILCKLATLYILRARLSRFTLLILRNQMGHWSHVKSRQWLYLLGIYVSSVRFWRCRKYTIWPPIDLFALASYRPIDFLTRLR